MYRALIVEDEPLMRDYLTNKLTKIHPDWVAGASACDGIEALGFLSREHFDAVITDIRMPSMDGLELAKYLHHNSPNTGVIILSGYDEFDYARTAMRLNVVDYLLKPLNDAELSAALSGLALRIEQQRAHNESQLENLLTSALEGDDAAQASCVSMLHFLTSPKTSFALLTVDFSPIGATADEGDEKSVLLQAAAQDCAGKLSAMLPTGMAILCPASDAMLRETVALQKFRVLSQTFESKGGGMLFGGYALLENDLRELPAVYRACRRALLLAKATCQPLLSAAFMYTHRTQYAALEALQAGLSEALDQKDTTLLSALCQQLALPFSPPANTENQLALGATLLELLAPNRIAFWQGMRVLTEESNQAWPARYGAAISALASMENASTAKPSQLIEQASEYIRAHFRQSISLSVVAEHFMVTPAYMSALFHKEVGESYSKYLIRLRMETAATLLTTDPSQKIYQIAQSIGFPSAKHFTHVFHEYFTQSPSKYREQKAKQFSKE